MSIITRILPPASPERNFGLLFGTIFAIAAARYGVLGFLPLAAMTLLLAMAFLITAFLAPRRLRSLSRAWMKLGELLHRLVSPVVLGAIYLLIITPVALVRRMGGHDALHRKYDPGLASYWVERNSAPPSPESFNDQF